LTIGARAGYANRVTAERPAWSGIGLAAARARREAAEVVAREAAAILQRHRGTTDVRMKGEGDLVTAADGASEAHIITRLAGLFPDDTIVGEEGGGVAHARAAWTWYVDPLDGTTNFVHGLPYSVSLGAVFEGEPAVGVVAAPDLGSGGRVWSAARGLGATRDGVPIRVSRVDRLEMALVATGFPYDRAHTAPALADRLRRALEHVLDVRRLGSAAIDLALVAEGTFPVFWESRLKPWDLAAGALLVREAGGRVSDHAGGDGWLDTGDVVASNGLLHDVFLHDVLAP
jgi:myo-inositol-1(or 4)-monophosphatase